MKKLSRVMKKALDASRAANDRLMAAEDEVERVGKKRDRASRAFEAQAARLEAAFDKSGGVTVVVQDNSTRTHILVDRIVSDQEDKSFRLEADSKSAKKLLTVLGRYHDTGLSLRCAAVFAALVKQLCEIGVLSEEDRLVAIEERYFVKDDNGRWFGILMLSFGEV